MPEEGELGRTVGAAGWPTVFGQHPPHHILVDLDTEYEGDLLSDASAAEARLPAERREQDSSDPRTDWLSCGRWVADSVTGPVTDSRSIADVSAAATLRDRSSTAGDQPLSNRLDEMDGEYGQVTHPAMLTT